MSNNTTFIYALSDPRDGNVRYIGKSNNVKHRFNSHVSELTKRTNKTNWIKSLLKLNLKPDIFIVDEVDINEWQFWEIHYISLFKYYGFKLTNSTIGGECGPSLKGVRRSDEVKRKISEKAKNRSYDSVLKMIKTKKERAKEISDRRKAMGLKMSDESKEKLRKLKLNMSDEYRMKISLANKGRKASEKAIENQKIAHKNQKNENLRVSVCQLDFNNNVINIFNSIADASRFLRGDVNAVGNISMCAMGKKKSYRGYKWKYQQKFDNENINNQNF